MKFILGRKIKMSQLFAADGRVIPVTVIEAGPCQVTQVKDIASDGYRAVQIGFGKKRRLTKALFGHLKNFSNFRHLKEFRLNDQQTIKLGQTITAEAFNLGDHVKVTGISKGKGFQGVVKRHGFHGSPKTHGHKDQLRMPGSIGSTDPAHVFKGMRMGGRMGGEQVSLPNVEIAQVEAEKNLIYLKGAVPGAINGLLIISGDGELKEIIKEVKAEAVPEVIKAEEPTVVEEPISEETK
jgi:large subunit ribosomal protein L3